MVSHQEIHICLGSCVVDGKRPMNEYAFAPTYKIRKMENRKDLDVFLLDE